jgi:hypothetical protein
LNRWLSTDHRIAPVIALSNRREELMSITVNVENFRRAETDRMFAALLARGGGLGIWHHDRALSPLDEQTVIRQNRDTRR